MAHVYGSNNAGFGNLDGWSIIGDDGDDAFKRAEAFGPTGNEVASDLYDETVTVSTRYQASSLSTPTIPATLGATINSLTLIGISISTSPDGFAEMTLSGHRHVSPGTHGTVRTASHGITLDRARGVSAFGVSVTETNGLYSSTCNIETQHQDAPGTLGHTIAGENYDGKITIEVTATGTLTASLSGYDCTSVKTTQVNSDFKRQSATFIKALAMA